MTALSSDRKTVYFDGTEMAYKVAASTKIYAGSLVCLNTSGYAVPAADTANYKFIGVAMEQADNSSGADGAISIRVRRKGIYRFAGSSLAITDIGAAAYVADDQTIGKTGTNSIKCGTIATFVSATEVGIDIDQR